MAKSFDLGDLQIQQGGFSLRGEHVPFAELAHLRFARVNVTTYVVPVKIGTDRSVGLLIELKSGAKIELVEKPGWFFTSNETKLNGIVDLYTYLAKATFESRAAAYLAEAEGRGYFNYSGYKFYLKSRVIASEEREFTLDNTDFLRAYNYIELRPKKYGLFQKLKRELSWSPKFEAIDTLTDTDVIFAVLEQFYGLRWQ